MPPARSFTRWRRRSSSSAPRPPGRVVDKAVQIHGGRGYMREEPVERLWRELRVDRIWEGTSEIQRAVIGNELRKRGPEVYTGWPALAIGVQDSRRRPRADPGSQIPPPCTKS